MSSINPYIYSHTERYNLSIRLHNTITRLRQNQMDDINLRSPEKKNRSGIIKTLAEKLVADFRNRKSQRSISEFENQYLQRSTLSYKIPTCMAIALSSKELYKWEFISNPNDIAKFNIVGQIRTGYLFQNKRSHTTNKLMFCYYKNCRRNILNLNPLEIFISKLMSKFLQNNLIISVNTELLSSLVQKFFTPMINLRLTRVELKKTKLI